MSNTLAHDPANAPPPPTPPTPAEVVAYLDYHLTELIRRRDEEIIPALRNMAGATIADGDDEMAGVFAENQRMARALMRTCEDRREEHKRPWLDGGRAVDDWAKRFVAALAPILAPVERELLRYTNRKAQLERDRRAALAAAAQAEARKAAEAAAAAMSKPDNLPEASAKLDEAAVTAARAADAERAAAAKPAELGGVRGIYGTKVSPRTTWRWELIDIDLVPAEYLIRQLDVAKLREAARERDPQTRRPLIEIPGIRWVEEQSLGGATERQP